MRARKRGRAHGAAMMVWLFFANLFEPNKIAATEHIETANRIGNDVIRPKTGARPGEAG